MLAIGDRIPAFAALDEAGGTVRSEDLRGRPFVLFFYPRAGSWGCTREAMGFATRFPTFEARGVAVLGISVDPPEAQRAFRSECRLPFPLLTDRSGAIARQFGVLGAFGFARRVTFVIGPDGRILQVTEGLLPGAHIREALERLDRLRPESTDPGNR